MRSEAKSEYWNRHEKWENVVKCFKGFEIEWGYFDFADTSLEKPLCRD